MFETNKTTNKSLKCFSGLQISKLNINFGLCVTHMAVNRQRFITYDTWTDCLIHKTVHVESLRTFVFLPRENNRDTFQPSAKKRHLGASRSR